MMADTDEKINECIEKSLNYLSAIGRPIDLKYEQRISIQHLLLGKDVIAILPTGVGKCTIFTVCALTKVSWGLSLKGGTGNRGTGNIGESLKRGISGNL